MFRSYKFRSFKFQSISLTAGLFLSASVCAAPTVERQAYLDNLLKQDCGSCHGLTLKGGLGSAIRPEDISERSDEALFSTIKLGLPGLAMPPWGELLSDTDIQWLVERLRKGETE